MGDTAASFSVSDYLVFTASLAISFGIGVYQWWRSRGRGTDDFLMGGGKMSPFPVALSLLAGIVSAISILGNSSEMYYYGSQLWMNVFGVMLGATLTALLIMPIIYPLKLISIYQILEVRWKSPLLRKLVTVTQVGNIFIFLGIAMYAPSLAISSITPIPTNVSIIVLAVICSLYASLGGAKAVVYTDTFQTFVMFAGVIVVIIQGCAEVGGGTNSWNIDDQHGRIEFFNMDPSPLERHTFMTTLILGTYFGLNTYGSSQVQFQRWGSVGTLRESYMVMVASVVCLVVMWSLINYAGLVVFSVYADCDPLTAGYIEKPDQILVYFVVDKLGYLPGVPGLFVAAVYSGVLSSVSSSLNAIAAMIWTDLLQPTKRFANTSEAKAKNITVAISMVSGIGAMVIGILAGSMGGLVQVSYAINGAIAGPIAGLVLTAILCPWVKSLSATLGMLCGLLFNMWIVVGNFLYAPPPTKLPLSTEGCPDANFTTTAAEATTFLPLTTTSVDPHHDSSDVFPLYLLSYCLFGAIGLLTSLVMSTVFSCFFGFTQLSDVPEKAVNKTCLRFFHWLKPEKPYLL